MADIECLRRLETLVGRKLHVRVNNNRSTMLSVRWSPLQITLSLHRIFLEAPSDIQHALASYLRRDDKRLSPLIKRFIAEHTSALPKRKKQLLITQGACYDLEAIYTSINSRYFDNALDLSITWFGSSIPKNRRRCSLGLYYTRERLVKVHRLLDTNLVPQFVVEYIVYHEMVHAVCPGSIDHRGFHRVHDREFKLREQQFSHYSEACKWLKTHRKNFFEDGLLWQDTANGRILSTEKAKRTPRKANSLLARLKKLLTP